MKLQYVDSLRGIAILMVILVHSSHAITDLKAIEWIITSYGQMGVQLFFVASAFTLCLSADKREGENNRIKNYAIRRYLRIAPLYYFGLALYLTINLLDNHYNTSRFLLTEPFTFANILTNITFTHGFYAPGNNSVVPGGWSIAVEVIFYLLFPFIHSRITKQRQNRTLISFLVFMIITIISQITIFSITQITNTPLQVNSFLYFNIINQLPVFCLGILYYYYRKDMLPAFNWKVNILLFATFTFITIYLGPLGTSNSGHRFSVTPILSGVSFLFLFELFRQVEKVNIQILKKIGRLSFSMYILHFISTKYILSHFELLISSYLDSTFRLILYFLFTVLMSYLLAAFTQRYIEAPFIKLGKNTTTHKSLALKRI